MRRYRFFAVQTLVSDRPVDRWLKLAGGFVMLTGIAVWIGQLGHLPWLATWLPGELPMMLNTAFCVALCGGALLGLAWRSRAVVFACSVVVVGLA